MSSHLEALLALARRADPDFAASLLGVPEEDLRRVEDACRVRLPESYSSGATTARRS